MNARILVIEDNPVNMELMTYMLKAFGHEPIQARDGTQGLDLARTSQPDLILCDIQIPGLDGYALAQRLKQDDALRWIPLIAVTAYAMVGDREKVLAAGFDGYVAKPIDPAELANTIATILAQAPPEALVNGATTPSTARHPQGAAVLVLDDQDINLHFQRDLLEPLGYRVLTAHEVSEALEMAVREQPSLIISDVGLTGTHGFEFLRRVKADARLREVPFMFLTTTHWDAAVRDEGLALGADRFLFRPMDTSALLAEIRCCLSGAPGAQSTPAH